MDLQAPNAGGMRSAAGFSLMRAGLGLLLAQVIAFSAVMALGHGTYRVGSLEIGISLGAARLGWTTLRIPPLGQVSARTHRTPVEIRLLPEQVHVRSLRDLLAQVTHRQETLSEIEHDAHRAVRRYLWRLGVLAFFGGVGGSLIIGRRRWNQWMSSGLCSMGIVGVLALMTFRTYRVAGFHNPEYTGVLSEAPQAIDLVRRGVSNVNRLRTQLRWAATNLAEFYVHLENGNTRNTNDSLRVLHVSDIHNNPAALDFITGLTKAYGVRLILCSGDMTDYGTPLENMLLMQWNRIGVPTFFIGGNHDSRATLKLLEGIQGARVLADGQVVQFAGLTIAGWNDPVSQRDGLGSVDHTPEDIADQESALREWLDRQKYPPAILMVHHYRVAEALAGEVPLIVYGHDHRPRVEEREGTVLVDAGTTGASGVRYFAVAQPPPYSAALLHFSANASPMLQAVDLISVEEPGGNFTVTRTTIGARFESLDITP